MFALLWKKNNSKEDKCLKRTVRSRKITECIAQPNTLIPYLTAYLNSNKLFSFIRIFLNPSRMFEGVPEILTMGSMLGQGPQTYFFFLASEPEVILKNFRNT